MPASPAKGHPKVAVLDGDGRPGRRVTTAPTSSTRAEPKQS
jgi:hypothetical protein